MEANLPRLPCSASLELLSKRRLPIAGVLHLSFALHVNHFDPTQDHASAIERLEPEHRAYSPFDGPMILLDTIVQVGTLPDANGFQITPCSILEPIGSIAGEDRFKVRLAAVDHNPLGSAVALERLAQEPLGSSEVSPFTEPELDRVAMAIDGTMQIPPLAADLDVGLIEKHQAVRLLAHARLALVAPDAALIPHVGACALRRLEDVKGRDATQHLAKSRRSMMWFL
jgi:hypothetical protein